jgi:hypothetical protein
MLKVKKKLKKNKNFILEIKNFKKKGINYRNLDEYDIKYY